MLRALWLDAEGASLPASGEAVGERLSFPSFVERTATLDAHGERTEASFALGVTHGGARGGSFPLCGWEEAFAFPMTGRGTPSV